MENSFLSIRKFVFKRPGAPGSSRGLQSGSVTLRGSILNAEVLPWARTTLEIFHNHFFFQEIISASLLRGTPARARTLFCLEVRVAPSRADGGVPPLTRHPQTLPRHLTPSQQLVNNGRGTCPSRGNKQKGPCCSVDKRQHKVAPRTTLDRTTLD